MVCFFYFIMDEYVDYLAHHGVLGMKWGHRKQKSQAITQKQASEAYNYYLNKSNKLYDKSEHKKLVDKYYKTHKRVKYEDADDDQLVEEKRNIEKFLAKNKYNEQKDKYYQESRKAFMQTQKFTPETAKEAAIVTGGVVATTLAPIAAIATKKIVGSGKAALGAYIATTAATTIMGYQSGKHDQIESTNAYNEYLKEVKKNV